MREKVIKIFAEVAKVDEREVSESTSLRSSIFNNADNLGLDFFDEIKVILYLERAFDIKLPDNFLEDAGIVGDVIESLKEYIK